MAKLRDQSNLITSLSVFVNEERLVGISDLLIVPGLVVVFVGSLNTTSYTKDTLTGVPDLSKVVSGLCEKSILSTL